jgi:hypothetical protein
MNLRLACQTPSNIYTHPREKRRVRRRLKEPMPEFYPCFAPLFIIL